MKIPAYIEKIILRRIRLAKNLNSADNDLYKWLSKNGIEVEEYDVLSGCEMYANPAASAERIRNAILSAKKGDENNG